MAGNWGIGAQRPDFVLPLHAGRAKENELGASQR
jgi:hypothetical protein